jgi:tetratricopeptide (TPR) repeat protein
MNKKEVLELLPGLKKSVENEPDNFNQRVEYFWRLNDLEKIYLEENDYYNSIKIIKEQFKYSAGINNAGNSIGWNIYKHLKGSEETDSNTVNDLVNILCNIDFDKPSILYSQLAWILLKQNNGELWLVNYFKSVGLSHFSGKDKISSEFNGRKISPMEVRIVQKVAKIIEANELNSDYLWILECIEKLLISNPNEIWLKYHKGKLLLLKNKKEDARKMILEVLKKQKTQFWAWSFLGETYEIENIDLALSFFCKAVTLGNDETMLLGTRLKLAKILQKKGMFAEAKYEINKVIETRKSKGFKLTQEIQQLTDSKNIKEAEILSNNKGLYQKYSRAAENIFLDQFEEGIGIITNVLHDKRIAFAQISKEDSVLVKLNGKNVINIGDYVKVLYERTKFNNEEKLNAAKYERINGAELNFVNTIKGKFKLHSSGNFGFVENVFIHSSICGKINDGDEVSVLAVNEFNKKKKEYGWKGVLLF